MTMTHEGFRLPPRRGDSEAAIRSRAARRGYCVIRFSRRCHEGKRRLRARIGDCMLIDADGVVLFATTLHCIAAYLKQHSRGRKRGTTH